MIIDQPAIFAFSDAGSASPPPNGPAFSRRINFMCTGADIGESDEALIEAVFASD